MDNKPYLLISVSLVTDDDGNEVMDADGKTAVKVQTDSNMADMSSWKEILTALAEQL